MRKQFLVYSLFAIMLASCGGASQGGGVQKFNGEVTASSNDAIVSTVSGKVAGYIEDDTYIYKGIPYAKAERFMPPVKITPWEGVRHSRAYGPTAPQGLRAGWRADDQAFAFDWKDGFTGEDCQVLNIWTKGINDGLKRPVMVWFHGGGFTAGAGDELPSYDGKNLAAKDVVVVTLNHRLNVLGFLDLSAFGDKYAKSGNVGILDLIAALQWVKENIANFGGDPNNVTIFGQSGGGGKVSTLLAAPSAKGLFNKAIVQSGSMLNMMESKYSKRIGAAVVEELGLKPSQIDKISSVPYAELLAAGDRAVAKVKAQAEQEGSTNAFIFGWSPTVDGDVLPAQPGTSESVMVSKDIPVIIGTTLTEFGPFMPHQNDITMEGVKTVLAARYGDKANNFIEEFAIAYPGAKPVDYILADYMFRPGAVAQGNMRSSLGCAPVYMYIFAWNSPVLDGALASMHCMEIPFVFNNIYECRNMTGGGEQAYKLANIVSDAWVNFAKTGNPSIDGWIPYNAETGATMIFDNQCQIRYNHDKNVLDFVSSFPVRGL